ncbi:MAG TPA: GNAT family N-acetyltransferase [Gaiellaceae bacterium]|nr:GNAT family N-acetyltransferase [Gaiellaceae bacterium]
MSPTIRTVESLEEARGAIGAIGHYFGGWPADEEATERFTRNLPLERLHAALDEGRIVGGAGAFPFRLSTPGGEVGCAGVTVVGVLPTHRRRGVLTSLMRTQLDDVRRRGEPIAALWASEEAIYRRFGYGMAALGAEVTVPRGYHALRVPQPEDVRVRLISLEEAQTVVPPVYERVRRAIPGMYARSETWWESRLLADPPDRREDGAQKNVAVVECAGEPVGYALYRVVAKWELGVNVGHVRVLEALAADGFELELWRFLLGVDWISTFRTQHLPLDHPLLHGLVYPRRARLQVYDTLFVRVVDVAAALAARTYGTEETLVFELADSFLPDNAGRWRLAGGAAERRDDEPELALDVNELGSLYLGGFTATELARAGLVRELRPGALAKADLLFASPRKPWCPEIF